MPQNYKKVANWLAASFILFGLYCVSVYPTFLFEKQGNQIAGNLSYVQNELVTSKNILAGLSRKDKKTADLAAKESDYRREAMRNDLTLQIANDIKSIARFKGELDQAKRNFAVSNFLSNIMLFGVSMLALFIFGILCFKEKSVRAEFLPFISFDVILICLYYLAVIFSRVMSHLSYFMVPEALLAIGLVRALYLKSAKTRQDKKDKKIHWYGIPGRFSWILAWAISPAIVAVAALFYLDMPDKNFSCVVGYAFGLPACLFLVISFFKPEWWGRALSPWLVLIFAVWLEASRHSYGWDDWESLSPLIGGCGFLMFAAGLRIKHRFEIAFGDPKWTFQHNGFFRFSLGITKFLRYFLRIPSHPDRRGLF